MLALLSACGGGGGNPGTSSGGSTVTTPLFTSAPAALILSGGATSSSYSIGGGLAPYTVSPDSPSLLSVSFAESAFTITAAAGNGGSGAVVVTDSKGTKLSVAVTVSSNFFTDASPLTTLSIGATNFITVFGGVPFAAPAAAYVVNVSNPQVVRVALSGNRLSVTGLTKGSATVGISDSRGTITTLQFTVPAPSAVYTDAPSLLSIASGTVNTYTVFGGVQLTGGSASYSLNNSDPTVVNARFAGSTLTVGGLSSGNATLVISDSAGASATISVTVTAQGDLRTTAPASLTLAADGLPNTYGIAGGDAPYTALSDNRLLVTVATSGANGATLTITAKTGTDGGKANVSVTDAKGKQVSIQVTVPAPAALFTTAPSPLAIAGGGTTIFAVFGGSPPYSVVNTNPAVVAGSVAGSALSIAGSMVGSGTVVVSDVKGAIVPITVAVIAAGPLYLSTPGANVTITTSATYDIVGGVPPYFSSSTDLTVAQATIVNANQVRVNALGTGSATIAVTDSAGAKVPVVVTVPGPSALLMYTTAPTGGVFLASTDPALTYQIYGGRPAYTVTSSNTNVVQASLTAPGSNQFTLQAIAGGKAKVLVLDSAGLPVTIDVNVGSVNGFFVAAPATLNMGAGSTSLAPYRVSGGAKPYSVATSDSRVATALVDPVTSLLTVTAVSVGIATLQVADAIGSTPYTISVVVDNAGGIGSSSSAVATIDILATSNTLNSTPGSTVGFVVTVKNGANAALPNQAVVFTASSGTLTGANPAPVTSAAGAIATVSLSPGADASNRSITVTATTGGISKSIVIPVVGTTVSVSGPGAALVGSAPQNFTLKAVDSSGKPVVGAGLTIASSKGNGLSSQTVTTDISGSATVLYTATNAGIGTDTLTVSGQGTSGTATVVVSNVDFAFTAPAPAALLPVTTATTVTLRYALAGVGQNGQTVNFATTRGTLYADALLTTPATSAVTAGVGPAAGVATIYVKSDTAGPVTVSAQLGTARSSLTAAFVATVPATLVLQANPAALLPNAAGSTTNQSALTAVVRDAIGNPVQGAVVNFNAIADASGGSIAPGSVTTDASGTATAQFIAGPSSTAANGVQIRATVQSNPAILGDTFLTANGSALFISIARSNTLTDFDSTTYQKNFSVYVTDATGAPAGNRAVTLSVDPISYGKGTLTYVALSVRWDYTGLVPAVVCQNEDQLFPLDPTKYRNGILDALEDVNGNGKLEPGSPAVIVSSVTTDALGFATFTLRFGKNYAWWVNTQIVAKSLVSGTESKQVVSYLLEMSAADAASAATPANVSSPFGVANLCTNPN
jgi:hypothetical protein